MQTPIPICINCKNFNAKKFTCLAFPDGIPEAILTGESDHTEPLPEQDNDIVFEPLTEAEK